MKKIDKFKAAIAWVEELVCDLAERDETIALLQKERDDLQDRTDGLVNWCKINAAHLAELTEEREEFKGGLTWETIAKLTKTLAERDAEAAADPRSKSIPTRSKLC